VHDHLIPRIKRSQTIILQSSRFAPGGYESFCAEIEAAVLTPASEKKSNAGRKPIDVIVMFGCWCCKRFTICPACSSSIKVREPAVVHAVSAARH
jgi:hypothetical protein